MLKLAFYKGKGNWVDRAIRLWTGSTYSHVEFLLDHGGPYFGLISSSPRNDGVRYKVIPKASFKPRNWDLIDVSERLDTERLGTFFRNHHPAGYDFSGILLAQIIPLGQHHKQRFFCSEFCAAALGFANPQQYSPQDLFAALNMKQETA